MYTISILAHLVYNSEDFPASMKLLQSVIQNGLPVMALPILTIALRTATSIFSISLKISSRSFLSKR